MTHTIESREQRVIRPLLEFFSKENNFRLFLDVVVFKSRNLPLRLLDWFTTNYSKGNEVSYKIKRPDGTIETFNVFRSYRAQLKGCKKKEFDPFCRGDTIVLEYVSPTDNSKVAFETAICQLKFFKWSIENLILNYVEANYDAIYDDMKQNSSKSQKSTDTTSPIERGTKRKKNELSKSIFQQLHVSRQQVNLTFP
jgi:hypothetical protein